MADEQHDQKPLNKGGRPRRAEPPLKPTSVKLPPETFDLYARVALYLGVSLHSLLVDVLTKHRPSPPPTDRPRHRSRHQYPFG